MARILVHSSPSAGHVLPLVPGLQALQARGHSVHLRADQASLDLIAGSGIPTTATDSGTARLEDHEARHSLPRMRFGLADRMFRGAVERNELKAQIAAWQPDLLIVDGDAPGATVAAQASGLPWVRFHPSLLPLADRAGAFHERPDLTLALTSAPLVAERATAPAMRFVGAQEWDAPIDAPAWLREPGNPWVLVSAATEYQRDEALVATAIEALRHEPVRVLVTVPAAFDRTALPTAPNVRVEGFLPHGPLLDHAVVVICHGGMGITQRAIAAGVPIVAVPFAGDQHEIASRIAACGAGVAVPLRHFDAPRLLAAFRTASGMGRQAAELAAVLNSRGGGGRFADAIEELTGDCEIPGTTLATARDIADLVGATR